MVAVQFACPHCSGLFQVDDSMSGQQVACPHCRGLVVVPSMGTPGPAVSTPYRPTTPYPPTTPYQASPPAPQTPTWPSTPAATPGGAAMPQIVSPAPSSRPILPPSAGSHQKPSSMSEQRPVMPGTASAPGATQGGAGPQKPLRPVPVSSSVPAPTAARPLSVPTGPASAADGPVQRAPRPVPVSGVGQPGSLLPPAGAVPQLPPGVGGTPAPVSKSGATPVPASARTRQSGAAATGGPIVLPTEDGGYVTLRDPVKTIGHGDEEIELRTLSPEEKARRKLKRNLILWGFGLLLIAVTLALLLFVGPIR